MDVDKDMDMDYIQTVFFYAFVIITVIIFGILIYTTYCRIRQRHLLHLRHRSISPVVVTSATHTVPGPCYPPNSTMITQQYPVHGYVQQGAQYPPQQYSHPMQHSIPPYPMPQPAPVITDNNPPSYDQVVSGEAYQKQAPYNPNFVPKS